jgi:hypothetical protein
MTKSGGAIRKRKDSARNLAYCIIEGLYQHILCVSMSGSFTFNVHIYVQSVAFFSMHNRMCCNVLCSRLSGQEDQARVDI